MKAISLWESWASLKDVKDWDRCPNCGSMMVGDGYTMVKHCELIDINEERYQTPEPDAAPIFCDFIGAEK